MKILTDGDTAVDDLSHCFNCFLNPWKATDGNTRRQQGSELDGSYALVSSVTSNGTLVHRRHLPSVTMPRVPSAPMKSLVRSKPAEDLLLASARTS